MENVTNLKMISIDVINVLVVVVWTVQLNSTVVNCNKDISYRYLGTEKVSLISLKEGYLCGCYNKQDSI